MKKLLCATCCCIIPEDGLCWNPECQYSKFHPQKGAPMFDPNHAPYTRLSEANASRQIEWAGEVNLPLSYAGNELAGECGEACNVIKKLERERYDMVGSRDTKEHLAEELADVVICAYLVAQQAGIDLDAAIPAKFNATSEKNGLKTRMEVPADVK